MKKKLRTRDPMARELRTPRYKARVVRSKKKIIPRKQKHKGIDNKVKLWYKDVLPST